MYKRKRKNLNIPVVLLAVGTKRGMYSMVDVLWPP